jgi:hypothetical protein
VRSPVGLALALAACAAAAAGCAGARLKRHKAKVSAEVPSSFAVNRSTSAPDGFVPAPFTVHPSNPNAPYPAPFFLNFNQILSRYLEALQKDPALQNAYDGYYRRQTRTFEQFWQTVKRQADRLGDLVAIYPGAALPIGAYRTVRGAIGQGEDKLKKELSEEDEVAAAVNADIRLAIQKVARENRLQLLYDSSSGNPIFVDPLWDMTDPVYETLLKAKAASLAEKAPLKAP